MYKLTCKMCGKEFTSKGGNAYYCKNCKLVRRKAAQREHNKKKRITSVARDWDIEKLSKPATKSMKRLHEISRYGAHYYMAKEKWEEKHDKRKIKKLP